MVITWDERKRRVNLDKHGIDFADLNSDFFAGATILASRERRFVAIGRHLEGKTIFVVFRRLGREGFSIVSARPANAKERRHAGD